MWLDLEACSFRILDILRFTRKKQTKTTPKRGFTVISCRLSGETVFSHEGKNTYASPQDLVLIPANIAYGQTSSAEEIICIHLEIEGLSVREIMSFHCTSPHLRQYFITLHRLWQERERGYLLRCKGLIYDILFELDRLADQETVSKAQPVIAPAVKYIQEHYLDKDFSLSRAIAAAYISPAYFRRVFKTVYGVTPKLFVNRLRIDHAKLLMAADTTTLREVSERCGFLNEKYFFSVFKKITGTTPSEWRRMHI